MPKLVKILLLDHHAETEKALQQILAANGHQTISLIRVDSFSELKFQLGCFQPDLIISDYQIAGFTAIEVLDYLKHNKILIPFVIFTNPASEEIAASCIKAGASEYILKSNISSLPARISPYINCASDFAEPICFHAQEHPLHAHAKDDMPTLSSLLPEDAYHHLCDLLTSQSQNIIFIFELSKEGAPEQFIYFNEATCQKLGYSYHELKNLFPIEIFSIGCCHTVQKHYESLTSQPSICFFAELTTKEGLAIPTEVRGFTFMKQSRIYAISILQDARRQAAHDGVQQNLFLEKFSPIFHLAPIPIAILSRTELMFMDVNDNFIEQTGWEKDEILGKGVYDLHLLTRKQFKFSQALKILDKQGYIKEIEISYRTKSGEIHYCLLSCKLFDLNGKECLLAMCHDISHLKHLEFEKQRKTARKFQTQKMLSLCTLTEGIAHDFNNLMGIIMLAIDVIRTSTTDPEQLNRLKIIANATERGSAIARKLLIFSQSDDARFAPISLEYILKNLETLVRATSPKTIKIYFSYSAKHSAVFGDAEQLSELFSNLITNAIEAMPHGGTLRVELVQETNKELLELTLGENIPDHLIAVRVIDSGHGISEEAQMRIFEPFFTTKESPKGSGGLGLAVVHGIVQNHQGYIDLQSSPSGTIFTIYFPLLPEAESQKKATEMLHYRKKSELTILIIDHNQADRNNLFNIIKGAGFNVIEVDSALSGLNTFKAHLEEIDLVIAELHLPIMDGETLCKKILEINPLQKVILSYEPSPIAETRPRTLCNRTLDMIPKPFQADDILNIISKSSID
ncbi:signal transduction histidine kinase, nitrogen specific, NtrB [Chloroherpeton thalassium ATCC 35110]|uniref:histidine kinase n=1 Tax=Chloroherpeton thalassium (strain ATCC 35110 / GB-78) TaxID=517418 RepID=B3QX59_CHLT3|nr:ATP-binding protein [Chloroherpeton thalassium]ACF14869.1 signal transduction histidine kinase, nitrogen specific, NtrB [Chloroherpeton thalassium ATCC 35110]